MACSVLSFQILVLLLLAVLTRVRRPRPCCGLGRSGMFQLVPRPGHPHLGGPADRATLGQWGFVRYLEVCSGLSAAFLLP